MSSITIMSMDYNAASGLSEACGEGARDKIIERRNTIMELVFSRKDMSKAMQAVNRAVGKSAAMPVLANVLISAARDPLWDISGNASDGNGSIYVAATDLEMGIRTRIPGCAVDDGAITLPAQTFASVISALTAEDVKLITSKDRARIRSEKGEYKIVGMSADQFPSLMGEPDQGAQLELTDRSPKEKIHFLSLNSDALGWMIRKTSYAAASDDARLFLNGVHLSTRNDGAEQNGTLIRMAASDGTRLAIASVTSAESLEKDTDAIIPIRAVNQLEKLTAASDVVKMAIQENRIVFDMDDSRVGPRVRGGCDDLGTALVSRLLEGEYPDYEQVIPDQSEITLKVDTGHFLSVARRIAQVADPKLPCVRLEIRETKLKVSASSTYVGDGCEEMDIDHEGSDVGIAINVRYLIDALRAIDTQETLIGINGEAVPMVIKPSQGDHLCVLMPVCLST